MTLHPTGRGRIAVVALVGGVVAVTTLAASPSALAAAPAQTVVTGTVTGSDGRPLQNVQVRIENIALQAGGAVLARTDRSGAYRLVVASDDFLATRAQFQFDAENAVGGTSATGYADACHRGGALCTAEDPQIDLTTSARRQINVRLPRAGVVTGRVTDPLGRGVGSLPVLGIPSTASATFPGFGIRSAVTDTNGNYTLRRVDPVEHRVEFGASGIQGAFPPSPATPNRDGYIGTIIGPVAAGAGVTTVVDATLTGGGAVSGRVVDQFGNPVSGATVEYPSPLADAPATSGADGSYRLGLLPPSAVAGGPYQICASAPRSTTACSSAVTVRQFRTTTGVVITLHRDT